MLWKIILKSVLRHCCCWEFPASTYLFKVNNRNTRTMCEICSKLTIKTTERRQFWCLYCELWTYFTLCSTVSFVNFEQINAGWVEELLLLIHQGVFRFLSKIELFAKIVDGWTPITIFANNFPLQMLARVLNRPLIFYTNMLTFSYSKSTVKPLEKSVKYVQS